MICSGLKFSSIPAPWAFGILQTPIQTPYHRDFDIISRSVVTIISP